MKIGNTPIARVRYKYGDKIRYIYSKLEYYNITGSIKDRIAYYIITNAKKTGALKENMCIVEATSGNTGISLAALGAYFKHKVYIFMPDWVSIERVKLLKMYGATVYRYSKQQGGFLKCINEAKNFALKNNGFLANQFENENNILAHYNTTAREILRQVPEKINGFVSGIGTGGTLIGISKRLKQINKNIVSCAIEPDKMPMLSQNKIIEQHKIEGIGDDFIPKIVDRKLIDKIILVNDDDCVNMSRKLAKELGLGVGISSGANMLGSIILQNEINKNVVTVFPDDNKKYISTDLSLDINNNEKFISSKVQLLDYQMM